MRFGDVGYSSTERLAGGCARKHSTPFWLAQDPREERSERPPCKTKGPHCPSDSFSVVEAQKKATKVRNSRIRGIDQRLIPPENMVPNFRPELLSYVKRKAKRNLFGSVAECVSRRVSDAWNPGRGHCRGGVVGGKIGNVERCVALVIVSQEAVEDSVEGATRDAVATSRNVADIFMQEGSQGGLKSTLKNGIATA